MADIYTFLIDRFGEKVDKGWDEVKRNNPVFQWWARTHTKNESI